MIPKAQQYLPKQGAKKDLVLSDLITSLEFSHFLCEVHMKEAERYAAWYNSKSVSLYLN